MMPSTSTTSTLQLVLEAILAGLQIAAQALPVITAYQNTFGGGAAHLVLPITEQATAAHPVTGAIVNAMLTAPPAA